MLNLSIKVRLEGRPSREGKACRMLSDTFTFKFFQHTINTIRFGMKGIVAKLIMDENEDEHCTR